MAQAEPSGRTARRLRDVPERRPTVFLHMRRRCGRALSRLLGCRRRGRCSLLPWAGQVDQAAGAGLGRGWRHSLLECGQCSAGTAGSLPKAHAPALAAPAQGTASWCGRAARPVTPWQHTEQAMALGAHRHLGLPGGRGPRDAAAGGLQAVQHLCVSFLRSASRFSGCGQVCQWREKVRDEY